MIYKIKNKLMSNNLKNRKYILIFIIMLAITLLFGSSYALLQNSVIGNNEYTMNVGNLQVTFLNKNSITPLSLENAYPISDEEGINQSDELTFTITNNGTLKANYNIYIEEVSTTPEFKTKIRFISKKESNDYSSPKTLSVDKYIDKLGEIDVGETVTYKVKVWLDESADSTYMNKNFLAKIVIQSNQFNANKNNIIKYISTTELIQTDENVSFANPNYYEDNGQTIDNGNGLFVRSETEKTTNPIYYYRGDVNNNVLLGNYCFKILRTTDTGGTKLIYNGEQYTRYNKTNLSNEEITYTNDSSYPYNYDSTNRTWTSTMKTANGSGEFSFHVNTNGNYVIDYTVSSHGPSDYVQFLKNETLIRRDSGIDTNNVVLDNLTTSDVIKVIYSKNDADDYGNDEVTFSIGLKGSMIETVCPVGGEMALITLGAFNSRNTSIAHVGYNYGAAYEVISTSSAPTATEYGKSVSYDNGVYTLVDTDSVFDRYHHYMCHNQDCSEVRYYTNVSSSKWYYLVLSGGKVPTDLTEEMLTNSTDENKSTIQVAVNDWYSSYLLGYASYFEDAGFCNDRTYSRSAVKWTGAHQLTSYIHFNAYYRLNKYESPNLGCDNPNDILKVSNGKLTYPIALLTTDEAVLAGIVRSIVTPNNYLASGISYWTLTSSYFANGHAYNYYINYQGVISNSGVHNTISTRPVVSLKPETTISSGSGTLTNPYVVSLS